MLVLSGLCVEALVELGFVMSHVELKLHIAEVAVASLDVSSFILICLSKIAC